MKFKAFKADLIWLCCIFTPIALVTFYFWNPAAAFDINLHDAYLSIQFSLKDLLFPFALIVILVYSVRILVFRFKKRLPNLIFLISGLIINMYMISYGKIAEQMVSQSSGGWTIYPPLSALHSAVPKSSVSDALPILNYFQIILTGILVIVALITGINWYATKHEQA